MRAHRTRAGRGDVDAEGPRRRYVAMGTCRLAVALSITVCLCWLQQGLAVPPSNSRVMYNVLDYGAIGDGQTDDTDAIQRALHFAGRATRGNYAPIDHGGDASLQHPTLLFPTGAYLLR